MSVINKKPFIVKVLETLTAEQTTEFKNLIDGEGNFAFRSLDPRSNSLLSDADKGVKKIELELGKRVAQNVYRGYLIYNNTYCVLVAYSGVANQGLTLVDIDSKHKPFTYQIRSCELSIIELRSELDDSIEAEQVEIIGDVQDALDNGVIKIVAGNINSESAESGKVLVANGSGEASWGSVDKTNYAFPASWPTTNATTTKAFCDIVNADSNAVAGMSYLGEVRWSDLPSTLVNAEVLVEVMAGTGTSNKVIHLSLTSGNLAPYRWEYTYWNNGNNVSGWIGFQPEITSSNKLSSDLVDDTNHTHKFVTAQEKTTWNDKVDKKPDGTNDLISNNKISTIYLPDILLGQLVYGGTVTTNAVATLSTNAQTKLGTTASTITLTNDTTAVTGYTANEGIFYVSDADFTFASLTIKTGDWLISTGAAWSKIDNTDEVTSVQIQATLPVQSSQSSAQTGPVQTTISLADAYGDTKNPYGSKTKNYVLASPNGSNGAPSFRALVKDDLPSLSASDVSATQVTFVDWS